MDAPRAPTWRDAAGEHPQTAGTPRFARGEDRKEGRLPAVRIAVCVAGGWLLLAATLPAAGATEPAAPADVWVKEVKVKRNAPKK